MQINLKYGMSWIGDGPGGQFADGELHFDDRTMLLDMVGIDHADVDHDTRFLADLLWKDGEVGALDDDGVISLIIPTLTLNNMSEAINRFLDSI